MTHRSRAHSAVAGREPEHAPVPAESGPAGPPRPGGRIRAARLWLIRAACVLLAAEVGVIAWYAVSHRAVDFTVYLWGGHAIAHGTRLYLARAGGHWFTYPPFAAAVFAVISVVPPTVAQLLWALASVAALAVAGHATLRLAGWAPSWPAVVALTAAGLLLEPVWHTLFQGQVNLILLALVLTDVWRAARDRRAGLGVGIAAAVKLTPAIFVLLFLLTRRTKAAVTAAGAFAACTLIGYVAAPGASRLYWTKIFFDTRRMDAPYVGNQSLYGAAVRLLGGTAHVGPWFLAVTFVVGAVGLAAAAAIARRGDWLSGACVTGVTGLLVSPVSWTHHWVWVVPALVVLLRGGRADRIAAACGCLLFALAPLWWTPHSLAHPSYGFHGVVTFVANCYVLAGVAFLACMAVRACRAVSVRAGPDHGAVAVPALDRG